MKNFSLKSLLPHGIAVAIFLIVALVYCKPAIEGKVLQQEDIVQWLGMSKDQQNVYEKTGTIPLWSNGMFSGMPGYLIKGRNNNILPYYFVSALSLGLPKPINFFFLACICFYFLSQVLKVNSWIGISGALTFAYDTFNITIIVAGHDTQMLSIALVPGLLASLILLYEKNYWSGTALTALFVSALISQNHYQISYYGMIIALFATIGYAVTWIKEKQFKHFILSLVLAALAGTLGLLSNAVVLLTNYEYTNESIRGGSVLADTKSNETKTGLSEDYAFSYSLYKSEPFVLLIPHIFGGSDNPNEISEDKSKAIESIQSMPQQLGQQLQGFIRPYWGGIGGSSGPAYIGAIVCFLALIGFAVLDNKHKWWILAASAITILMSWGGYFKGFNGWLLNHLPMYNKFRVPSMILVIPTLLLGTLAVLSLDKILFKSPDKNLLWKQFKKGLIITGSVFVVALLLYISFDYQSENDKNVLKQVASADQQIQTSVRSFFSALKTDRQSLFFGDILRSLAFILVAAVAIWAFIQNKLKPVVVTVIIGVCSFIDVLAIDVNYLNSENYRDADQYQTDNFQPTAIDKQILQDTSYYRVLDLRNGIQGTLTYGAKTAYFHHSIGGYHPAKLSIYQDLIEKQLSKFPNCLPVLDMLNTKYIIGGQDPQNPQAQINPGALGPVWFVKAVKYVPGPKEEMSALDQFNPKDTLITQQSFSNVLKNNFTADSSASISLVKNQNDIITYHSKSATEQAAVFSEVYYNKGWNVYVDGNKASYGKANYVLRAMMVPAGEHTIVFKFEPETHRIGWDLTKYSSIILLLLLLAAIVVTINQSRKLAA